MISITLSADEIRLAPPEVRRWLDQQLAVTLSTSNGPQLEAPPHLVPCSFEELQRMAAKLRDVPGATRVLFEFGRGGHVTPGQPGVHMFRTVGVAEGAKLEDGAHFVQCLELLNQTLQQIRAEPGAMLCGWDERGFCYVHEATHQNLHRLWSGLLDTALSAGSAPERAAPIESA